MDQMVQERPQTKVFWNDSQDLLRGKMVDKMSLFTDVYRKQENYQQKWTRAKIDFTKI